MSATVWSDGWVKLETFAETQADEAPTVVGTPGSQTKTVTSLSVLGTTTDAATVTVTTTYVPTSGHAAKLSGEFSCTDRTNHNSRVKVVNAIVDNYSGLAVKGTPAVSAGSGDAGLSTATVTFGVSGGGKLTVVLTPPNAYSGTLDWFFSLTLTEN